MILCHSQCVLLTRSSFFFFFSTSLEKENYISYNARAKLPISKQRKLLNVYSVRREILYAVETFATVILIGQTGCGKTTQVPQYLCEAGWAGRKVVLPRGIAITLERRERERDILLLLIFFFLTCFELSFL